MNAITGKRGFIFLTAACRSAGTVLEINKKLRAIMCTYWVTTRYQVDKIEKKSCSKSKNTWVILLEIPGAACEIQQFQNHPQIVTWQNLLVKWPWHQVGKAIKYIPQQNRA